MTQITIEPATAETWEVARDLLGVGDRDLMSHPLPADQFLLVAQHDGQVVAALGGQLMSGRGVLTLPTDWHGANEAVNLLIASAHGWFRERNASCIQMLDGGVTSQPLIQFGYQQVTEILTLEALCVQSKKPTSTSSVTLEVVAPSDSPRLADLLARTYEASAELTGFPESNDALTNLRNHVATCGREARWSILRRHQQDVGLILMGSALNGRAELQYIGLISSARRQGLGSAAIAFAFRAMHRAGVQTVLTRVDIVNEPAIHFYASLGFFQTSRQDMLVYRF